MEITVSGIPESIEDELLDEFGDELEGRAAWDHVAANRVVSRIREERRQIELVEQQFRDQLTLISNRVSELRDAHEKRIEWLLGHAEAGLREFVEREIAGKKERSVTLLSGRIGFRKSPDALEITEQDTVMEWCKANLPDAIKVVESVQKTPIKQHVKATGEIPPGTEYKPGEDRFYIE